MMRLTKRAQRTLLAAALTLLVTATAVSGAVWWMNHEENDYTVEVDSFDDKHLGLDWTVVFSAHPKDGSVIVAVDEIDTKVLVENGYMSRTGRPQPTESEQDDPPCNSNCWQGYAVVEATSEPGLTNLWPYTSWVEWPFYPTMRQDGETTVKFRVPMPSDGKDCRNNVHCDQIKKWEAYGKWTLTTRPFTLTWTRTTWGDTYGITEETPLVEVYEVVKS